MKTRKPIGVCRHNSDDCVLFSNEQHCLHKNENLVYLFASCSLNSLANKKFTRIARCNICHIQIFYSYSSVEMYCHCSFFSTTGNEKMPHELLLFLIIMTNRNDALVSFLSLSPYLSSHNTKLKKRVSFALLCSNRWIEWIIFCHFQIFSSKYDWMLLFYFCLLYVHSSSKNRLEWPILCEYFSIFISFTMRIESNASNELNERWHNIR